MVRFQPPVGQEQLADWFRAASVLVMPSYSESFGLVGESGSGKSTLLRAVAGLASVTGGQITVIGAKLGVKRDKAEPYKSVKMKHPRHVGGISVRYYAPPAAGSSDGDKVID